MKEKLNEIESSVSFIRSVMQLDINADPIVSFYYRVASKLILIICFISHCSLFYTF